MYILFYLTETDGEITFKKFKEIKDLKQFYKEQQLHTEECYIVAGSDTVVIKPNQLD